MSENVLKTIALCGNPNVGKSTLFNELTGLNQHTGNWPGKTVLSAFGKYSYDGEDYRIVDLPGTYSLIPSSAEEEVTRDYICFEEYDCAAIVLDATSLERSLIFGLQTAYLCKNSIICINLIDEAKRNGIKIDYTMMSSLVGVPIVSITARNGHGIEDFKKTVKRASNNSKAQFLEIEFSNTVNLLIDKLTGELSDYFPDTVDLKRLSVALIMAASFKDNMQTAKYFDEAFSKDAAFEKANNLLYSNTDLLKVCKQELIEAFVIKAEEICKKSVLSTGNGDISGYGVLDRRLDRILTSKKFGIPIMIILLCLVFWLTIVGANYPSEWLATLFDFIYGKLYIFMDYIGSPEILTDCLLNGIYKTLSWVVSVMLPPMAIFFPLFSILEDTGVLPRIAFNLDKCFKTCGAHGKMALTMCMGAGCNACGVTGCRIIESKRERLIAIITNNFIICNGRFPTVIAISSCFLAVGSAFAKSLVTAFIVSVIILIGALCSLLASKILSKTLLKGQSSSFALELPSFRKPEMKKVLVRSLIDKTLKVLLRAVVVSAPAGLIIWILANLFIGDSSLLNILAEFFEPFGKFIGLDGIIVLSFLLGFPANEIVIPTALMGYLSQGHLVDYNGIDGLYNILVSNGWEIKTAICMLILMIFHYPCATASITIYKETKSLKWTAFSMLLPTIIGIALCAFVNAIF